MKQEEKEEEESKQTRKLLRRSVLSVCVCAFFCKEKEEKSRKAEKKKIVTHLGRRGKSQRNKTVRAAYFGSKGTRDCLTVLTGRRTVLFLLFVDRSRTESSIHQCQPCQISG